MQSYQNNLHKVLSKKTKQKHTKNIFAYFVDAASFWCCFRFGRKNPLLVCFLSAGVCCSVAASIPPGTACKFVLFFISFHRCSVWFSSGYHCKIVSKWSGMPTKCITLYLQHCGCHSFLINFVKHFLKKGCVVINSKSVKGNFFGVFIFIYIMSCMFVIFYRIYCNEYLL